MINKRQIKEIQNPYSKVSEIEKPNKWTKQMFKTVIRPFSEMKDLKLHYLKGTSCNQENWPRIIERKAIGKKELLVHFAISIIKKENQIGIRLSKTVFNPDFLEGLY